MSKLAPYYRGLKDTITEKRPPKRPFSVLFAIDLSTKNITILENIIAHKQIASKSTIIEVV